MSRKTLILVCLMLTFVLESFSKTGSTGWWILRRPGSTKPKPVTAVASVRGDLSGVFYNPSILGTITQREVFLLTETGMVEDTFGGILYGQPLNFGQGAGICAGAVYYDAGRITLYWMDGGDLNERDVNAEKDILYIVSYGQKLNNFIYFGGNYKYATSNIAETGSATAQAFDVGLFLLPTENIVLSLAGQNLGTSTAFIDTAEELPTSAWLGIAYTWSSFSLGLDIPYILKEDRYIPSVGIQYSMGNISFNVGYRFNVEESVLHAGIGVKSKNFEIGYAIIPPTYMATPAHRISLGYLF